MTITVALDAFGGDHGPTVIVPAALSVLAEHENLHVVLVGEAPRLERAIGSQGASDNLRLSIRHASQTVAMDDSPSQALRTKKDSSMRVALNLVKEGLADACVSAGNTGALMATARFVLRTLPGIDRPAIISALPTIRGHTHLLDLGANVDSTPGQLFQFAVMGSVLTNAVDNIAHPRIGLLNIGEEEIKGNQRVREAARLLMQSELNYVGFVEGDDIYRGAADVIVCDGFVGNVALKSSEGVAHMISHYVKQEFTASLYARLAGLMARPVLSKLRRKIDPRCYNGASLVGLRGIVVKSHGGADAFAFANAIREAIAEVQKNVPARISKRLESVLTTKEAV
ncbi:MAG: phosphate acyltransferase PlsX [Gammaproteobacteria bacterium]